MSVINQVILNRYRRPKDIDRGLVLDLPLNCGITARKGTLAPTFARNSTAAYINPGDGLLKTAAVNEPRFEAAGLLMEPQTAYSGLYSRDLTQADWVKTDCTPVRTQVGLDGTTNGCSLLTATAANATCLQTVTAASAIKGFQADIKRVTGTGNVYITVNGGSTWVDVTSLINSTTFSQVFCTATVTNPQFGFKLATSGDAIAVDFANLHDQAVQCSRVTTTSSAVTRYADTLSYAMSDSLKSIFSVDQGWTTSLEDETGLTFGPEKNRCSFADGQAWFGHADLDASPYANAGYVVILRDSTGKLAWSHMGAAGSGETLGSELVTNGGFDSNTSGWTSRNSSLLSSVTGGVSGNCLSLAYNGVNNPACSTTVTTVNGKQYVFRASGAKGVGSSARDVLIGTGGWGATNIVSFSSGRFSTNDWTEKILYGCPPGTSVYITLYLWSSSAGDYALFDSISAKEVITPASTCVYVYKDAALTQQGWNMESGFNMNGTSYSFDIVPASQIRSEGTVMVEFFVDFTFSAAPTPTWNIGVIGYNGWSCYGPRLSKHSSGYSSIMGYDGTNVPQSGNFGSEWQNKRILGVYRVNSSTGQMQLSAKLEGGSFVPGTPGAYDGSVAVGALNTVNIHASSSMPVRYKNLRIFNRWLDDSEIQRIAGV